MVVCYPITLLGQLRFPRALTLWHSLYHLNTMFMFSLPLLRFFLDQHQRFTFTIIVPRLHPHRYWWAILQALAVDSLFLGKQGAQTVLRFPSRTSTDFIAKPLPWDLWVFRCICF